MPTPRNALAFKRRLLRWFRRSARDLPWRRTRDPYRVLISEVMLQQTPVSRVKDQYTEFLYRFPTMKDLARARPAQVREAWEGLGYYRRAADLHALARIVVRRSDGRLPTDTAELARLPGVGRYTAGALASFAFERRAAAVDTNVARVLTRVFKGRKHGRTGERELWSLAERLLPHRPHVVWEFNQALMDLGATICAARKPKCGICPVRPTCRAAPRAR